MENTSLFITLRLHVARALIADFRLNPPAGSHRVFDRPASP
jgi:hypothetical protein